MFNFDGHGITLTIFIKFLSLVIFVSYLPFVINKTIKGGTCNTLVLITWSSAVAAFITLQWLVN